MDACFPRQKKNLICLWHANWKNLRTFSANYNGYQMHCYTVLGWAGAGNEALTLATQQVNSGKYCILYSSRLILYMIRLL